MIKLLVVRCPTCKGKICGHVRKKNAGKKGEGRVGTHLPLKCSFSKKEGGRRERGGGISKGCVCRKNLPPIRN